MRALVTGATGYLGFHLCRHLLDRGCETHALMRPGSDRKRVAALGHVFCHELDRDLANLKNIVEAVIPDAVFSLAAAMPGNDADLTLANEQLPIRLGTALADMPGVVVVHAASWWEWDENGVEAPANAYAASKATGRHALEAAAAQYGFRLANLVLHETYGPADWRGKILDHMLDAAIHGREMSLTPGEQMMDLVHVSDVAAAFRLTADYMARQPAREPALFAVATGAPVTLRALAEAVETAAGKPLRANWGVHPYRPDIPLHPGPMASPPPGWAPEIDLTDGLLELATQHRQGTS
jgi:nucleoside-diphosphate-sugar epimerase